jgi:plastocyanin
MSRPNWKAGAFAALLFPFACASLPGIEHTIDMFQSAFLPQTLEIDLGDSVRWVWQKGTHTVTSGLPNGAPGTPDEPGTLFDGVVDASNTSFSLTFDSTRKGGYPFFCRQHPNQIGFIEISSGEISVRIAVVDNVFNPDEAFIFEGDSIRWEHEPNEGFHTVTSGLSSNPGDNPAALFDEESSNALPVFVFRFEDAGDYPFFCRPHEEMGMRGRIHVQEKFVRGDASGDGKVDISDAVAVLNVLFLGAVARCCDDALDANDDGAIDIADPVFMLQSLFIEGTKIPPPYPLAGGDRTDDALQCCHRDV